MLMKELKQYRQTLLNKIVSSEKMVQLVLNNYSSNSLHLIKDHIFPYPHIINTITKEGTYITVKISVPKVYNKTYKSLYIWIYIFSHENLVDTDEGLRTDLIAEEIEKVLNGSLDFGLGRLELDTVEDFNTPNSFLGIVMRYVATDFNRV